MESPTTQNPSPTPVVAITGTDAAADDPSAPNAIKIVDIWGNIPTVDMVPNWVPRKLSEQFAIYNGLLYFFDFTNGDWIATIPVAGSQYYSAEFDNGSVTITATINWNNGNVQYVTLTGDTTFTFSNPKPGGRYLLLIAGAHTPTFPATVRWSVGTTPTATASSGHKDIYTFVYSGKESLYSGFQNPNYATT